MAGTNISSADIESMFGLPEGSVKDEEDTSAEVESVANEAEGVVEAGSSGIETEGVAGIAEVKDNGSESPAGVDTEPGHSTNDLLNVDGVTVDGVTGEIVDASEYSAVDDDDDMDDFVAELQGQSVANSAVEQSEPAEGAKAEGVGSESNTGSGGSDVDALDSLVQKLNFDFTGVGVNNGAPQTSANQGDLERASAPVVGGILTAHEDTRFIDAFSELGSGAVLKGADWGIWRVLHSMRSQGFIPDKKFIVGFLNRNRELITSGDRYGNIHLQDYEAVSGDRIAGYISAVAERYDFLKKEYAEESYDDFKLAVAAYKMQYTTAETNRVLQTALDINGDGVKVGRKVLQGSEDALRYVREKSAVIESAVGGNSAPRKSMQELAEDLKSNPGIKPRKVCDFVGIPTLNQYLGGIWTNNLYTILAPPKSGKTKLCSRICHTALLEGHNVTVWAVEGGMVEWLAQLRAIHFDYMYNSGKSPREWRRGVTQNAIVQDELDDSLKSMENASYNDLLEGDYGSLDFVDGDFTEDAFLDRIKVSVEHNNSDLIIIDYMTLIKPAPWSREAGYQAIQNAFIELAKYSTSANKAIVTPAQYRQEDVRRLLKEGSANSDMRASAGGSSEVVRSSDYVIALWASQQDLQDNHMRILSVPTRKSSVFPDIDMNVDLATCRFNEISSGD